MGTDPPSGGGGGGGGGAKRRRPNRQGVQREAAAAEGEAPIDRISALPVELRERIVARLPFMDAVRSGALARGWRGLWMSCWPRRPSMEIRLRDRHAPERELDALEKEPRPHRGLHRFSLTVDTCKFTSSHLRRFLGYATECRVEDLRVEMWTASKLKFHLPRSSPLLARLSLRGIGVSSMYYRGAQPLCALEVVALHSVSISQVAVRKMLALCPGLRTLDLRDCDADSFFYWDRSVVWPPNLRSVTVAECEGMATLNLVRLPSLRSFRYSGSFLDAPFYLPRDAALADLYICFEESVSGDYNTRRLNNALPNDLSDLNVLTICSNALPVAFSLSDDGATCQLPKQRSLHSLRELQLLMLEMGPSNLADIYVFLKTFHCPNLEKLFVELPDDPKEGSHDEIGEEPPEDCLDNVKIVKVVNFNWHRTEVELVSFLLRKASSLQKLLLVSSKAAPLHMPGVQSADLLLIHGALTNGKIMLSESDDVATQPYHYEVFLEV